MFLGLGLERCDRHLILSNQNEQVRDIPVKPPLLATIKSNNYLINALTCEEAEDHVRYPFRNPIDQFCPPTQPTDSIILHPTRIYHRAASSASSSTHRAALRRVQSATWPS